MKILKYGWTVLVLILSLLIADYGNISAVETVTADVEVTSESNLETQFTKYSVGYGMNDVVNIRFTTTNVYISSLRQDLNGYFLFNHCIERTVDGHGLDFSYDDLPGEVQYLYYLVGLDKPLADLSELAANFKDLIGVSQLYDASLQADLDAIYSAYGTALYSNFLRMSLTLKQDPL